MTEVTTHNGSVATPATAAPTSEHNKPKASQEKVDKFKAAYVKADDAVVAAKEKYDAAMAARSTICEKMHDECGAGKYKIREEILTLTSRKSKGGDTVTYYMRGKTDDQEVR
jgi:hypothetical protein